MNSASLDHTLTKFANTTDIGELTEIAESLLKAKAVNEARHDQRFHAGLERCVGALSSDIGGAERLKALATAYRLGASSKPVSQVVRSLVQPHLTRELPPLEELRDGDDRYYASLAVLDADADWVLSYAARGVANEDTAEKARSTLARRLVRGGPLSQSLSLLATELDQVRFATENPTESASRRLRRVITSLRPALVSELVPPGDQLGETLHAFFVSPFSVGYPSAASKATEHLADECCALVHDILRTQLSVVAEPSIYRSLSPVRRWIEAPMWPRFLSNSDAGRRVVDSLESAIVLLAKQNVADADLLKALELFTESRQDATRRAGRLARDHPELDDTIREWLSRFGRGRSTPRLASMEESREVSADTAIASLLVLADQARRDHGTAAGPTISQILSEIEALARARGLELKLDVGEVVEYAPTAHELAGQNLENGRKVQVVQPLVQRHKRDGVVTVVRKAIVEPLGE